MSEERDHNDFDPEPWSTDLGLAQMINALTPSVAALEEMMFPGAQALSDQMGEAQRAFADGLKRVLTPVPPQMDLLPALQKLWRDNLPGNWTELTDDQVQETAAIMIETGISLAWVPRHEVVSEIVAKGGEKAIETLLSMAPLVVADLQSALAKVADDELADAAAAAREALQAFTDGLFRASQTLSAATLTAVIHEALELKALRNAEAAWKRLDPEMAAISRYRTAAILGTLASALKSYGDRPIPRRFNRHATSHSISPRQLTKANALVALLCVSSLLVELQVLADSN